MLLQVEYALHVEMDVAILQSKIMKLVLFILIVGGTSKQHIRMPWKIFH